MTFTPEGVIDPGSMDAVTIADRTGYKTRVVRDSNAWGYEVAKGDNP